VARGVGWEIVVICCDHGTSAGDVVARRGTGGTSEYDRIRRPSISS
jgi:hypothetical protein